MDEHPRHEAQGASLLRLLGFDRQRLAEQRVGGSKAGDRDLRDSANGCSQRLESGQFDDERVRKWQP
ncbi:MAG: hypothetical protein WBO69_00120 [Thermoanaerobaculia bacterium]